MASRTDGSCEGGRRPAQISPGGNHIRIGRNATLEIEEPVGIAIDFVLRRSRQADEERVTIRSTVATSPG
jgi:hypothetical protein